MMASPPRMYFSKSKGGFLFIETMPDAHLIRAKNRLVNELAVEGYAGANNERTLSQLEEEIERRGLSEKDQNVPPSEEVPDGE